MVGPSKTKVGLSMGILIEIRSWLFSAIPMAKPARRKGSRRNLALAGVDPAGEVGPSHKSELSFESTSLLEFYLDTSCVQIGIFSG
jgi:hypothetical protein